METIQSEYNAQKRLFKLFSIIEHDDNLIAHFNTINKMLDNVFIFDDKRKDEAAKDILRYFIDYNISKKIKKTITNKTNDLLYKFNADQIKESINNNFSENDDLSENNMIVGNVMIKYEVKIINHNELNINIMYNQTEYNENDAFKQFVNDLISEINIFALHLQQSFEKTFFININEIPF